MSWAFPETVGTVSCVLTVSITDVAVGAGGAGWRP